MQSLSPIYSLIRSDGSIVINKNLCHAIGLNETIIYSELLSRYNYFSERNALDEDNFFFNTVNDLQLATCIGEKPQKKAINNLKKLGLIEYKVKGIPPKRYFKIVNNVQLIAALLETGELKLRELKGKQVQSIEKSKNRLLGGIKADNREELKPSFGMVNNTNINNTNFNNKDKEHRVDYNNQLCISFQEFKELLFQKETDINDDAVYSMDCFTHYRNKLFTEIKYKYDIWLQLYEKWLGVEVNGSNTEVDYEDSVEMIKQFFNTQFEGNEKGECDYSPILYCNDKVKEMKFYDAGLY